MKCPPYLLPVLATAGIFFPCPILTWGQSAPSAQVLDSHCPQSFLSTALPSKGYHLSKIQLGIFDPPVGGAVYFQVQASKAENTNVVLMPVVSYVAEAGQNPAAQPVWWTAQPMKFEQFLSNGALLDFKPDPKNGDFVQAQSVAITPAIRFGATLFCLQSQYLYTWANFGSGSSDPDFVSEQFFGTTSQSPVYGVARIRWTKTRAPP